VNRLFLFAVPGLLSILLFAAPSGAAPSKDEANLARETARLDKTASSPAGEAAVVKRLARDFGFSADRVAALRASGLGYGELTVALSLAGRMAGGVTDENVGSLIARRRGPPARGWGEIAKQQKVKLGAAVSQVKKLNNEAHREQKAEHVGKPAASETAPAAAQMQPKKEFTGEGRDMTRGNSAK
jgi:hypothetical protein